MSVQGRLVYLRKPADPGRTRVGSLFFSVLSDILHVVRSCLYAKTSEVLLLRMQLPTLAIMVHSRELVKYALTIYTHVLIFVRPSFLSPV